MTGVTVGHFLIGMAIVQPLAMLWAARSLSRGEATPEQRRGMRALVVAAFVLGAVFILVALFVPSIADIPLF